MPEEQKINQELLMRAAMLHQQSQEIEQNLALIENQINELELFSKNLSDLEKNPNKEMLASIGRGVFTKAALSDKELFVDVGAGTIVKKTPQETVKVIESQVKKFKEAKTQLQAQLELFHKEMHDLIEQAEKEKEFK